MRRATNWCSTTKFGPKVEEKRGSQIKYGQKYGNPDFLGDLTFPVHPFSPGRTTSHAENDSTLWHCGENGAMTVTHGARDQETGRPLLIYEPVVRAEKYGACHDMFTFLDDPERIWMGTDRELWESLNGGKSWERQTSGIGPVAITSIHLTPDEEEIAISTWGRGVWTVRVVDLGARFTGVENLNEFPDEPYVLHPNHPNPFTDATTLPFSIRRTGDVRLEIYDLLGRKADILTDQTYAAGTHRVRWNANG